MSISSRGFHFWYNMEIDELYNKFSEYDIKWISLLCQKKVLTHTMTLFARLQVELWEWSCGYLKSDGSTNGSLQSKDISYQSKDNCLIGISNGPLFMKKSRWLKWEIKQKHIDTSTPERLGRTKHTSNMLP
jgi:hypothetical protein